MLAAEAKSAMSIKNHFEHCVLTKKQPTLKTGHNTSEDILRCWER
jgi:hypothetical protein